MRECVDCGTSIGIRATRCRDCRRIHRTDYERGRAQAARADNRERLGQVLGDQADVMTLGNGAVISDGRSVPNAYPWETPYKPGRAAPSPAEVDYTHGGPSAPGLRPQPDVRRVPNHVRQDRVAYEKEMLRAEFGPDDADLMPDNDMVTWDSIQDRNTRGDDGRVTFPAQGALHQYTVFHRSPARTDYLGRSVPRPRWS